MIREFVRKHRLSHILADTINWEIFECIFSKTYDITKRNQVTWKAPDGEIEKLIAQNVRNWKILLNKLEPCIIPVLIYLSSITGFISTAISYFYSDFLTSWNFTIARVSACLWVACSKDVSLRFFLLCVHVIVLLQSLFFTTFWSQNLTFSPAVACTAANPSPPPLLPWSWTWDRISPSPAWTTPMDSNLASLLPSCLLSLLPLKFVE